MSKPHILFVIPTLVMLLSGAGAIFAHFIEPPTYESPLTLHELEAIQKPGPCNNKAWINLIEIVGFELKARESLEESVKYGLKTYEYSLRLVSFLMLIQLAVTFIWARNYGSNN